jgi:hydrogenase maturation protein HypF
MSEHHLDEAIAIIFDGTGLGDDGTLWGGELFFVNQKSFTRSGHLKPFPLPGGTNAITSPWRTALAFCDSLTNSECAKRFQKTEEEINTIRMCIEKSINTPMTSSIGRLFDAAAALLQLSPDQITYEAQAAIKLEQLAQKSHFEKKPLEYIILQFQDKIIIDPQLMMDELLLSDKKNSIDLAFRFHVTIAHMILDFSLFAIKNNPTYANKNIVLSGGVFQNKLLLKLTTELLQQHDLNPIQSILFPPGDGQISLGQAMIARGNNI